MERPDFKNNKVVRVGAWAVAAIFCAQVFVPMITRSQAWSLPLFAAFMASAVALCIYMLTVAWRGGYRKYVLRTGIYLAILLIITALLAWVLLTTPGICK